MNLLGLAVQRYWRPLDDWLPVALGTGVANDAGADRPARRSKPFAGPLEYVGIVSEGSRRPLDGWAAGGVG